MSRRSCRPGAPPGPSPLGIHHGAGVYSRRPSPPCGCLPHGPISRLPPDWSRCHHAREHGLPTIRRAICPPQGSHKDRRSHRAAAQAATAATGAAGKPEYAPAPPGAHGPVHNRLDGDVAGTGRLRSAHDPRSASFWELYAEAQGAPQMASTPHEKTAHLNMLLQRSALAAALGGRIWRAKLGDDPHV